MSNVKGMLLFPDKYTHPTIVAQPVGINDPDRAGWDGNNYSADDFALMQSSGVIFLPSAGQRFGTSLYHVGAWGEYWSSSCSDDSDVTDVFWDVTRFYFGVGHYRQDGRSVRLVYPAD